ncbi:TonB-dependent receptor domain-containing protein [Noviherbaspirillum galbum]|uniref:TonB-dependent receptor n=1 Tax=Noviherbaspirillum galbum TaxID=2709383 RepID=A0A6B3SNL2_9BURK|nr:TonB-dependent receptor [Noviherbaspirillum galbum]NEX62078.1 TonB-dependent receptor [Noviherbaspirillum galbum]
MSFRSPQTAAALRVARLVPVSASMSVLAAIGAAMPLCAHAQQNQQAQQGRALEPVLVTATRTPQIAHDVLSDNVVITSEDIARSGQTTLVDLLQRQRGVEVVRNGGPGSASSVFIRGTDNNKTVVLVDGVRVGSSTLGGASWAGIPLSQIDHVEIVYGPLSSLYGADAMGGVVQIFTRQTDGAPSPSASVGAGSDGLRTIDAGVSGSSDGERKIRYAIRAGHEEATGFSATRPGAFGYNPDRDGYASDSASGRLSLEWAKGHEAGLSFLQSRVDSQIDQSTNFDDRNIQKIDTVALFSRDKLAANWTSTVQLARSHDRLDAITATGRNFFQTRQDDLTWQNDVTLGGDLLQFVLERREENIDTTNAAVRGSRDTNSVAAAYQFHAGPHLATASVRNDNSSQFGSHTTGNLAYGYRISGDLRASASIGTSFRAPTFNELYFPGYGIASNQPEKGRNAEAGLYYDNGATRLSAVYYRNRITDLLVYATTCPVEVATHAFGCAYNINEALLTGITFGGSTRLGSLVFSGSLDLQDPRDETADRQLARRARQHATVGVEYEAGALRLGGDVLASGKRFDDGANRTTLGGYGLLNLHASYAVARDWTVFGRWDNVFDKNYELARNYNTPGSSVFVGVRYGMR